MIGNPALMGECHAQETRSLSISRPGHYNVPGRDPAWLVVLPIYAGKIRGKGRSDLHVIGDILFTTWSDYELFDGSWVGLFIF